jgi:hypothetical protein
MPAVEVERLCPLCTAKSYGGGSTPTVKDGLVYRRRICLGPKCGIEWVTVEGAVYDNPELAEALGWYHELKGGR